MGNNTNRLAAMHDRWWDAWAALCHETLPADQAWDLMGAVMRNGRTAMVVWRDEAEGVVRVAVDQPLVDALVATDAGFLITEWLRRALLRYRRRPTIAIIPLSRKARVLRRQWMA